MTGLPQTDMKDIRKDQNDLRGLAMIGFRSILAILACRLVSTTAALPGEEAVRPRGYGIPLIDLAGESHRQVVVDKEPGQYLGHPTTVLLEDGKTMIAVYPEGHGRGAVVMKNSTNAGLTWSDRLPVPANWATSKEVDNHLRTDCAYPGLELLPDGTFVTTTYGHWIKGESPFIVSVRFKMKEIDARARLRD